MLDLVPVGRLVIPSDQTYHCGVVCKLDYGVRTMYREYRKWLSTQQWGTPVFKVREEEEEEEEILSNLTDWGLLVGKSNCRGMC